MKDSSWGGEIELSILSDYYECQFCVFSIETCKSRLYGTQYPKRIYLLYEGIHYDIIVRAIAEDMPEAGDVTVFDLNDDSAYEGALYITKELNKKKQFTNTSTFSIQCMVCMEQFIGQNEVIAHSKKTGHGNFKQLK